MIETHEPTPTVRRRDGSVVVFDQSWIERDIAAAFLRDADGDPRHDGSDGDDSDDDSDRDGLPPADRRQVQRFTELVQDQIELVLMRYGERVIARDYVIRRERNRQLRSDHGR
jgi:ribonucleoside-diphosphate reductase alpha chain